MMCDPRRCHSWHYEAFIEHQQRGHPHLLLVGHCAVHRDRSLSYYQVCYSTDCPAFPSTSHNELMPGFL